MKFPFCLDCKRVYAAQSAKADPHTIAAKYDDLDDQADQQVTKGYGQAGASKAPAKDGHGVEIAHVNEDDSDKDESTSPGARKPAWLQASAAAAKLDGGVSRTKRKKARGREVQFLSALIARGCTPLRAQRQNPLPLLPSTTTLTTRPTSGPMAATERRERPRRLPYGVHGIKIASVDEDDLDNNKIARVGATKPAMLQAKAAAAVQGKVSVRCGDGSAGMHPDNGVMAAARFALGVEGRMPNNKARAALESLPGTKVVRRVLAALRNNTNN